MIRLDCDYMEGAHPKVLQKLVETNEVSTPGYGNDEFTAAAKDKVREACGCPEADVSFLVGGTQTPSFRGYRHCAVPLRRRASIAMRCRQRGNCRFAPCTAALISFRSAVTNCTHPKGWAHCMCVAACV